MSRATVVHNPQIKVTVETREFFRGDRHVPEVKTTSHVFPSTEHFLAWLRDDSFFDQPWVQKVTMEKVLP